MEKPKKLSPLIVALIVIALVGLATAAVVVAKKSNENHVTQQIQSQTPDSTAVTNDSSVTYKDGTYTQVGRYISPGGAESIDVTVTIANEVITTASVSGNATRGDAKDYQDAFVSGFKSSVVGKNIHEVSLTRTAGASLTSNGFNAAIKLIKADAKA